MPCIKRGEGRATPVPAPPPRGAGLPQARREQKALQACPATVERSTARPAQPWRIDPEAPCHSRPGGDVVVDQRQHGCRCQPEASSGGPGHCPQGGPHLEVKERREWTALTTAEAAIRSAFTSESLARLPRTRLLNIGRDDDAGIEVGRHHRSSRSWMSISDGDGSLKMRSPKIARARASRSGLAARAWPRQARRSSAPR